jgi:hypothetical protein
MISVMLIIIAQVFIMVVALGWSMGAVEVVALIVFLGYVLTFNLHIAHAYSHAPAYVSNDEEDGLATHIDISSGSTHREYSLRHKCFGGHEAMRERLHRTRHACTMARSIIGSAGTTVGCAVFLLLCVLQFFVKFGVVIVLVTVCSLSYSLVFLPALLMVCGTTSGSFCSQHRLRQFFNKEDEPRPPVASSGSPPEVQYGQQWPRGSELEATNADNAASAPQRSAASTPAAKWEQERPEARGELMATPDRAAGCGAAGDEESGGMVKGDLMVTDDGRLGGLGNGTRGIEGAGVGPLAGAGGHSHQYGDNHPADSGAS